MEWNEIFPANTYSNEVIYTIRSATIVSPMNLEAHLRASWECIEQLQKQVKELERINSEQLDVLWDKVINRCDE